MDGVSNTISVVKSPLIPIPDVFHEFVHSYLNAQMQITSVQMTNVRIHIRESRTICTTTHVRIIGVARITGLSVQESADREPTGRNYMKTAPAITPTTAAAMEPPIPLPMLLPGAPFPLPLNELAEGDDEVPLDELLETDDLLDVTVTPNRLVDVLPGGLLPEGLVTEPVLFKNNTL